MIYSSLRKNINGILRGAKETTKPRFFETSNRFPENYFARAFSSLRFERLVVIFCLPPRYIKDLPAFKLKWNTCLRRLNLTSRNFQSFTTRRLLSRWFFSPATNRRKKLTPEREGEGFEGLFVIAANEGIKGREDGTQSKLGRNRRNFTSANFLRIKRKSGRKPQKPVFEGAEAAVACGPHYLPARLIHFCEIYTPIPGVRSSYLRRGTARALSVSTIPPRLAPLRNARLL